MKTYLTNARLVLPDRIAADSALLLEDGVISAVNPEAGRADREIDINGLILMPGMIDLHCDSLEKEVEPRPNVFFPTEIAVSQADRRNALAGITTVFHALSFAEAELGVRNPAMAAQIVRIVRQRAVHGLVDNFVHCRYEITDPNSLEVVKELIAEGSVQLLSVMDHTPGQGQFKEIADYHAFLMKSYNRSAAEADRLIESKFDRSHKAFERLSLLAGEAASHGIRLASHDDDHPERVETLAKLGVVISEFPVNSEAARAAKQFGLHTIFGAPNVLRGKSQSGSMRALDAIREGTADCLCADYHPGTMLQAVLRLPEAAGINLPEAVRLVTANPAKAAGLTDRGEIAVGKRADLVAVGNDGGIHNIALVFVRGRKIFQAGSHGDA